MSAADVAECLLVAADVDSADTVMLDDACSVLKSTVIGQVVAIVDGCCEQLSERFIKGEEADAKPIKVVRRRLTHTRKRELTDDEERVYLKYVFSDQTIARYGFGVLVDGCRATILMREYERSMPG